MNFINGHFVDLFSGLGRLLNDREMAYLIWGILAFISAHFIGSLKRDLYSVLVDLFSWTIIRIWLLMLTYMSAFVFVFYRLGWWDISLLKDTLVWFLFSGSVTFFQVNKIESDPDFFRKLLKDNIKAGIFLEYLSGLYTFSFWLEFLFIPLGLFLSGMIWTAKKEAGHKRVELVLNRMVIIAAFVTFGYVLWNAIHHWSDFFHIHNLVELLLAPVLTIVFIPFLYFLSLAMIYEKQLSVAHRAIENKKLHGYATWLALRHFGLDTSGLSRWTNYLWILNNNDRATFRDSVKMIKLQQRLEENPPVIKQTEGWSPYAAKDFLKDLGMVTGNYKPSFDNEWMALSNVLYLGDASLSNALSYFVLGNAEAAKKLELVAKVFSRQAADEVADILVLHVETLFTNAVGGLIPQKTIKALRLRRDLTINCKGYQLSVKLENWNNSKHSYDLVFSIEH